MGSASLLRLAAPFAAVVVLAVPPAGLASPDPAPSASRLQPDPAPSVAPVPATHRVPAPVHATGVASTPARVAVTHSVVLPVPVVTRPVVVNAPAPTPTRRPVSRRPPAPVKKHHRALPALELPRIVVPQIVPTPLERRASPLLAALALALAVLTAGSGAGLVRAWSRR